MWCGFDVVVSFHVLRWWAHKDDAFIYLLIEHTHMLVFLCGLIDEHRWGGKIVAHQRGCERVDGVGYVNV